MCTWSISPHHSNLVSPSCPNCVLCVQSWPKYPAKAPSMLLLSPLSTSVCPNIPTNLVITPFNTILTSSFRWYKISNTLSSHILQNYNEWQESKILTVYWTVNLILQDKNCTNFICSSILDILMEKVVMLLQTDIIFIQISAIFNHKIMQKVSTTLFVVVVPFI